MHIMSTFPIDFACVLWYAPWFSVHKIWSPPPLPPVWFATFRLECRQRLHQWATLHCTWQHDNITLYNVHVWRMHTLHVHWLFHVRSLCGGEFLYSTRKIFKTSIPNYDFSSFPRKLILHFSWKIYYRIKVLQELNLEV